jgi:hypothetical protein
MRWLGFQCVHEPEEERKTGVYAPQSLGAWTGETPEGLAVEQLAILHNGGAGACGYRYRPGRKKGKEKPKTQVPKTGTRTTRPVAHIPKIHLDNSVFLRRVPRVPISGTRVLGWLRLFHQENAPSPVLAPGVATGLKAIPAVQVESS